MYIQRHVVDVAQAADDYAYYREYLDELLRAIAVEPGRPEGIYTAAFNLIQAAAVAAPEGPVIARAVRIMARASAAIFTLHRQRCGGEELQFVGALDGVHEVTVTKPPRSSFGPIDWQLGMAAALIARDSWSQTHLGVVTADQIATSGVVVDRYQYAWIAMLKSIHRGESLAGQLEELELAAIPENVRIAQPAHVRETLALARAATAIGRGDESFNDDLAEALRAHRAARGQRDSASGNIALEAVAIASLAHDKGFPIAVDSEYMPGCLYYNDFRDDESIDVSGDD